jgi:hypothetical protein
MDDVNMTSSLQSLSKPSASSSSSSKPRNAPSASRISPATSQNTPVTYQNSPTTSQISPPLPHSAEFDTNEEKAILDPKIAEAIGELMDQRLQKFAGMVGMMDSLKPSKPNKQTKPASTKGIVTSLRSHYGGPSAAASVSFSASPSAFPSAEDNEVG